MFGCIIWPKQSIWSTRSLLCAPGFVAQIEPFQNCCIFPSILANILWISQKKLVDIFFCGCDFFAIGFIAVLQSMRCTKRDPIECILRFDEHNHQVHTGTEQNSHSATTWSRKLTRAVENYPQHIIVDFQLLDVPGEFCCIYTISGVLSQIELPSIIILTQ